MAAQDLKSPGGLVLDQHPEGEVALPRYFTSLHNARRSLNFPYAPRIEDEGLANGPANRVLHDPLPGRDVGRAVGGGGFRHSSD